MYSNNKGGNGSTPESDQPERSPGASVLGPDIVMTGNIEAKDDLQIEGRVNGDVRCATLILGESGFINGRIFAERVRALGSIEGSIDAKDLAVEASAKVRGEICYERVRIATGAVVEGTLKCKAEATAGTLRIVEPVTPAKTKPSLL